MLWVAEVHIWKLRVYRSFADLAYAPPSLQVALFGFLYPRHALSRRLMHMFVETFSLLFCMTTAKVSWRYHMSAESKTFLTKHAWLQVLLLSSLYILCTKPFKTSTEIIVTLPFNSFVGSNSVIVSVPWGASPQGNQEWVHLWWGLSFTCPISWQVMIHLIAIAARILFL
jgi:hypothetical protein